MSNLPSTLVTLRRWWKVIGISVAIVTMAVTGFSLLQERQYEASASLLFRDPGLDQKLFGSSFFAPVQDPAREAATNIKLVSLRGVAEQTATRLGGLSADEVISKVNVSAEGQSDVVSITAKDAAPTGAARLANAFAEQYIAFRRKADRSKVSEAQALVQRQLSRLPLAEQNGARGRTLRDRAEQLQILSSLQTGNAELVQRAEAPSSPASPRPIRNAIAGIFVGALLGALLALLFNRIDRKLRDPSEVEEAYDRPVLAAIPKSDTLLAPGHVTSGLPAAEGEAFRMLRASLRYFNVDRTVRSVLVTSASANEGKSTIAANLASTAASAGGHVLLIEADLRHPTLGRKLGLSSPYGLSTVLAGQKSVGEGVVTVEVPGRVNGQGPRNLDVLLAGDIPPNPSELIESARMGELLREAESRYDLVVLDTPPTTVVSDAIPLVQQVSGVVLVARFGLSTRDAAAHLRGQLEKLDAPTLGVVVNAITRGREGYGYGYGSE